MCGIFAWAGRNPATFNSYKFNILGVMNETRGKHSCGVTVDNDIYIGVDNNKLYRDFVVNCSLPIPQKFPVVIGHTRHATAGSHNEHNSHPFGFGNQENNNDYKFIGVHNGSLLNDTELANKRNISITSTYKKGGNDNSIYSRSKIDSEILLECIYKDGNYKVLSEYTGAAALVFTKTDEPNIIYCYHGKSKLWHSDKEAVEERPLYYYKESKFSLYISSIKESLQLIAGVDNESKIGMFKHNTVYKIKNGDISSASQTKISRNNRAQRQHGSPTKTNVKVHSYPKNNHNLNNNDYDDYEDWEDLGWGHGIHHMAGQYNAFDEPDTLPENTNTNSRISINIYKESIDHKTKFSGKIYMEKLRYKCKDNVITGCYLFIPTFGYYFIGTKLKDAEETFKALIGKRFYNGDFLTNEQVKQIVSSNKKDDFARRSFIPYKKRIDDEEIYPPMHYMFKGVRVKTHLDYVACLDSLSLGGPFDYESLSCCSVYPVCEDTHFKKENNQNILIDSKPANGIIAPLGSDKIYTFKDGKLIKTEPVLEDLRACKVIELPRLTDVVEQLQNENNKNDENMETCDLLESKIDEIFKDPFEKFPVFIKELESKYSDYKRGKEAIAILQDFMDSVNELINVDVNP